jgi:zinc protease
MGAAVVMAFVLAVAPLGCGGALARVKDPMTVRVSLAHEDFTLRNGLRVVIHREPSAQTAVVHLRYHVGSKDDPPGRSGLAHLFEHLMFRETRRLGPGDFMQRLEAAGGVETNASTTHDRTDYYEVVPPSELGLALWLEAARMAHPVEDLDDEVFTKERSVVENEWREHYEDTPYGNVYAFALDAVFGATHPYGRPTIGNARELEAATVADVRAFAARHYRPNNATLVVCSPFDPRAVAALVQRTFESVPGGPVPPRRSFDLRRLAKNARVDVTARVDGPMVAMAWPAPPPGADGYDELRLGLGLLEASLAYRLIVEKKIAESVDVSIDPGHLASLVLLEIRLKKGESPSAAIGAAEHQLGRTSQMGRMIQWDDFADYRTKQMIRRLAALESLDARAERIHFDLDHFGVADGMQAELRRVQDIPAADVGSAVEQFLADAPHVTIVVTPDPSAPRAGVLR